MIPLIAHQIQGKLLSALGRLGYINFGPHLSLNFSYFYRILYIFSKGLIYSLSLKILFTKKLYTTLIHITLKGFGKLSFLWREICKISKFYDVTFFFNKNFNMLLFFSTLYIYNIYTYAYFLLQINKYNNHPSLQTITL